MLFILGSIIVLAVVYVCALKYFFGITTWCNSKVKLNGKTALITGGNAGLGKATAIDLARRGARVIIASRNKERSEQAVKEIKEVTGNQQVRYKLLDLMDLDNVQQFADEFIKEEKRLDILINNSGIGDHSQTILGLKTKQNYELVFGVNHLGHFLLTYRLLDLLKKSDHGRIVNVSSIRHSWRTRPFSYEKTPDKNGILYPDLCGYSGSKLANVMHSISLSKHLQGSNVIANAVHPGFVHTDIVSRLVKAKLPRFLYYLVDSSFRYCILDATAGAQTLIYAAVDENVKDISGQYFGHCKIERTRRITSLTDEECQLLWDYSMKMCNLS